MVHDVVGEGRMAILIDEARWWWRAGSGATW